MNILYFITRVSRMQLRMRRVLRHFIAFLTVTFIPSINLRIGHSYARKDQPTPQSMCLLYLLTKKK